MKKLLLLFALIFVAGVLYAADPFVIYFQGARTEIHPVVMNNDLYLPLSEVAKLFHLKSNVTIEQKKVVLEPDDASTEEAHPMLPSDRGVVLGEVKLPIVGDIQRGVSKVKIKILKSNASYNEDENRSALEQWLLKNDSFFLDTHGVVVETISDAGGYFAFSKIPPGNYELVAFFPLSPTILGYWWLPLHVNKEVQRFTLNNENLTRIPLIENKS